MYKHLVKDKRHSMFNSTIHYNDSQHMSTYYNDNSMGDLSDGGVSARIKNIESNMSRPRNDNLSNDKRDTSVLSPARRIVMPPG